MKKQGFTLIELMVVIVIMGILAAVAVPKLFGMIAKSKASELGPAAGTYVKLQDAYVAEMGTVVGDWAAIGYNMPGSNNFTYEEDALKGGSALLTELGSSGKIGWKAKNNAKLNDCTKDSQWQITLKEASQAESTKGNPIAYDAATPAATSTANCAGLTPNFTAIGK